MEFKSAPIKADVIGLKGYLGLPGDYIIDNYRALVRVDFIANVTTKDWGISGISVMATVVTGTIEYQCDHDDPKQREGEIIVQATTLPSSSWNILDDIKPRLDGGEFLSVGQVTINFDTKEISVS